MKCFGLRCVDNVHLKVLHSLESYSLTSIYQSVKVNLFNLTDHGDNLNSVTISNLLEQKDHTVSSTLIGPYMTVS